METQIQLSNAYLTHNIAHKPYKHLFVIRLLTARPFYTLQ